AVSPARSLPHTPRRAKVFWAGSARSGAPWCAPRPGLQWKTHGLDALVERPAGGVHRRIPQRAFPRRLQLRDPNLGGGVSAFAAMPPFTGARQVPDRIGPLSIPGPHGLDLEGHLGALAVGARVAPRLEEIRAHLVARERALLIRHPADLGVLQQLGVELDHFKADGVEGQRRDSRATQVSTFCTRLAKDEGSPSVRPPGVGRGAGVPALPDASGPSSCSRGRSSGGTAPRRGNEGSALFASTCRTVARPVGGGAARMMVNGKRLRTAARRARKRY